jgi:hypothetical protein
MISDPVPVDLSSFCGRYWGALVERLERDVMVLDHDGALLQSAVKLIYRIYGVGEKYILVVIII